MEISSEIENILYEIMVEVEKPRNCAREPSISFFEKDEEEKNGFYLQIVNDEKYPDIVQLWDVLENKYGVQNLLLMDIRHEEMTSAFILKFYFIIDIENYHLCQQPKQIVPPYVGPNDYYLGIIKHLLIQNDLWSIWAWETSCDWDYYPSSNEMMFFHEMCYKYRILSQED